MKQSFYKIDFIVKLLHYLLFSFIRNKNTICMSKKHKNASESETSYIVFASTYIAVSKCIIITIFFDSKKKVGPALRACANTTPTMRVWFMTCGNWQLLYYVFSVLLKVGT